MSFIPYGKQVIDEDDIQSVIEVLKGDFLTTGPKVAEFEEKICNYTGAKYSVAVSNGTAALHLISLVLLQKGDKVLTTPNSFLATSNSILYANAIPLFIDICSDGNINLELCEEALKKDATIKALYVVHFSGNPINQEKLQYLKATYGVTILEDCAHSLGAVYNGVKAASCTNSDASILSFHPVKNLTTGEGGAITTNNEDIYEKLLQLRNHGMRKTSQMKPWEYEMIDLGYNYRITDIQCALGLSQFRKLPTFLEKRRELAQRYEDFFENTRIKPLYPYNEGSAYHLYVVCVDFSSVTITREELFIKMREKGVGLQLHYMPINKQPYYKKLGYGDELVLQMDEYYSQAFSLPLYPSLSLREQKYVVDILLELINA